jgi:hypothetical protein
VSSACFTADGKAFIFGDKFGDVFGCPTHPSSGVQVHLLGHYCATITALCVDSQNRCASAPSMQHFHWARLSRCATLLTVEAFELVVTIGGPRGTVVCSWSKCGVGF